MENALNTLIFRSNTYNLIEEALKETKDCGADYGAI